MNEIKIEIRWKVLDKKPIELTESFFKRNEWAILKKDNVINGIFSFGCADGKNVDVHINDRDGRNTYWTEKLINALKEEKANIQTINLYSKQKLEDMLESGIISTDAETIPPTESYKYTVLL